MFGSSFIVISLLTMNGPGSPKVNTGSCPFEVQHVDWVKFVEIHHSPVGNFGGNQLLSGM